MVFVTSCWLTRQDRHYLFLIHRLCLTFLRCKCFWRNHRSVEPTVRKQPLLFQSQQTFSYDVNFKIISFEVRFVCKLGSYFTNGFLSGKMQINVVRVAIATSRLRPSASAARLKTPLQCNNWGHPVHHRQVFRYFSLTMDRMNAENQDNEKINPVKGSLCFDIVCFLCSMPSDWTVAVLICIFHQCWWRVVFPRFFLYFSK